MKKFLSIIWITSIIFTTNLIKKMNNNVDIIIYIDPGHGGKDGGAIGYSGSIEKDINLSIAKTLAKKLEGENFIVYLTRSSDIDLASNDSKNRKKEDIVKRCNLLDKSSFFISIHCNSYQNKSVSGAQVFYKANDFNSLLLAKSIQESFLSLNISKRNHQAIYDKYILDNTTSTGVIVEVGFITNPIEEKNLLDLSYQEKIVNAIIIGINNYLSNDNIQQK